MWCYRYYRKCNQKHISVEVILVHTVLKHWPVAAPIRGCTFTPWTSMQKKKERKSVPRHECQLHLMIAKGWRTCRLCCSSIVTSSARRDHLSQQSHPALLPEHRQWIPAHHPCCYLCLTARKRKVKPVARRFDRTAASCKQNVRVFAIAEETRPAVLWIEPRTDTFFTRTQNLYPLCSGHFVGNQFLLWNPNEPVVLYMWGGGKELSGSSGRWRVSTRAAAAQRRLGACQWLSPNPDLIFVFDPQHGPETVWAAAIAVI